MGSCLRLQYRGTEDKDLGKNYPLNMVLVKQNVSYSQSGNCEEMGGVGGVSFL